MPLKYGSALYSKLKKGYWEKSNIKSKPPIFAIADFQGGPSMIMTRSGLHTYLYGYEYNWHKDETGRLHIVPRQIETHQWGTKNIPSGFFNQPGAENISAVVFNNSGTISKFLRMGMLAGFGSRRVALIRVGTAVDHEINTTEPLQFRHVVNSPDYSETWVEGFDVFHNPKLASEARGVDATRGGSPLAAAEQADASHTPDWQPLDL